MSSNKKQACTSKVFVTNLPKDTNAEQLEKLLSDVGPIRKCFVVADKKNGNICSGNGYVTFALAEDAASATKETYELKGQKVTVLFAQSNLQRTNKEETGNVKAFKQKQELKKTWKKKNCRLIIRNLSFRANEKGLKKIFSEHGQVLDVKIPTNEDGKKKGFAFVQFKDMKGASLALKNLNFKAIEGRQVAIDFSIPKKKYAKDSDKNKNPEAYEISDESDQGEIESDREDEKEIVETEKSVVFKPLKRNHSKWFEVDEQSLDEHGDIIKTISRDQIVSEDSESEEENSLEPEDDSSQSESAEEEEEEEGEKKKPRHFRENDGRTLFVRNLSFMTEEEDFQEAMEELGPIEYAVLCRDAKTEMPKGTAFVKFRHLQDAQNCLEKSKDQEQGGVVLEGRNLLIDLALSRKEAVSSNQKEKKPTDKRNLYLAREGLIRPGTQAAIGVSQKDLVTRKNLEFRKKRLLKDLQYFVSKTRLAVYNLPLNVEDKDLKRIMLKASKGGKINECRIMRDNKKADWPSKGFGYVNFSTHKEALSTLRQLNNNPEIFTEQQRPIVEFSIENRLAVKAQEKRKKRNQELEIARKEPGFVVKEKRLKKSEKSVEEKMEEVEKGEGGVVVDEKEKSFAGFQAREEVKGLPSHTGPKIRKGKKTEKKKKLKSKLKEMATNSKTTFKQSNWEKERAEMNNKRKRTKRDDKTEERNFQDLVSKYKSRLIGQDSTGGREKWFD